MTERRPQYRGPWPGEVPLSRSSPAVPLVPRPAAVPDSAPPRSADPEPRVEPATEPGIPLPHAPDRAPTPAERRRDGRAMVAVLAEALSAQLGRLAGDDGGTPDGWWFTPQR